MIRRVNIEEFLATGRSLPIIDVRTPAEYARGHIPGAHNLPLFSNEERAVVGTIYKQKGPDEALLQGLDYVGPRMRTMVGEAGRLAPQQAVAVHCWRGGKRSDSLSWLLDFAGFDVQVLIGGYKTYRQYVLDYFNSNDFNILILGGHTGAGKTEVLHYLRSMGEQVVDLEGIAHHKGSAFGALGEIPQPSVEQFENDLVRAFQEVDPGRRIWLENESRSIGKVFIPEPLWDKMRSAVTINLAVTLPVRVERLVADYAGYPKTDLIDSFQRIRKRLGGQHLKAAIEALHADDFAAAAEIALRYYDKTYSYGLEQRDSQLVINLDVDQNDARQTARQVLALVREKELLH